MNAYSPRPGYALPAGALVSLGAGWERLPTAGGFEPCAPGSAIGAVFFGDGTTWHVAMLHPDTARAVYGPPLSPWPHVHFHEPMAEEQEPA